MRLCSRISLVAAAALILGWSSNLCHAESQVGDMAPDFSMMGSDGKMHKLSDYKGKEAVVIAWFPKAFTGGCTKECKSMKEFGSDLKQYKVAYFTASCDTPEENKKFAESLGLDYPILSDPSKKNAEMFGVLGKGGNATRWTFYIDKHGKIVHVDKGVKTESHGKDVAAKLQELGVAKKS
ncbi:MAG TPA: peroxiredoxin [Pirellulales bacterium]|jgi:peroxiredoxin Q/BCP|nr:peroxiredoxin [Pirellulales bacterium]